MKIAIITRADDSSPKVLAEGLQYMLENINIDSDIFSETGALLRLQSVFKRPKHALPFSKRLYTRIKNYNSDIRFLKQLHSYDAIVLSECSPNGFWKNYYNIEKLRKLINKPIIFYEVYYLGNTPTQIEQLKKDKDPLYERYDWHFSVSEVTEIRQTPSVDLRWTNIGLNLEHTNLTYKKKKEFIALVDFKQPGYEEYREEQIRILKKLNIPYISLEKRYPMAELREIYNKSALCFMQFPEAFGVPIAELFATGAYILTPDSSWPMSWRLDEAPKVHAAGKLPDIFKTYSNGDDLENQLLELKENWKPVSTPKEVFQKFLETYPDFYFGDSNSLKQTLNKLINAN